VLSQPNAYVGTAVLGRPVERSSASRLASGKLTPVGSAP